MQRKLNALVLSIVACGFACQTSLARGNDFVIMDGQGEQVTIKHGFFGRNTKVVKDRFGDGFAEHTGLLGTKEKDVNVLGNGFRSKKGILGGSDITGSTIFGDQVETKKGIFGRRTTYVNASGTASVLRGLWNQNKSKLFGTQANNPLPQMPLPENPTTTPAPAANSQF